MFSSVVGERLGKVKELVDVGSLVEAEGKENGCVDRWRVVLWSPRVLMRPSISIIPNLRSRDCASLPRLDDITTENQSSVKKE